MRVRNTVAVITGASSGIGRATALAFAKRGADVVLAARRGEALEEVADECRSRHRVTALAVPTDVADAAAVDRLAREAVEQLGRIDVWVNAAAVTFFGPFTEAPLEAFRRVLDVNVMGYVHGARSALAVMREQGRGVLVNVSSVVGVVAQPYTSAYGMSKHAVRALGASLRQELRLEGATGIKVCTVLPATIDTPLFQQAGNYTGRKVLAMPPVYSPERVARAIVDVVRAPRHEVVVGPGGRSLVRTSRLVPGLVERGVARQADRTQLSRTETAPATAGNLHVPAPGTGAVHGGWAGGRRTAVRRLVTVALIAAAVAGAGVRRPGAAGRTAAWRRTGGRRGTRPWRRHPR